MRGDGRGRGWSGREVGLNIRLQVDIPVAACTLA